MSQWHEMPIFVYGTLKKGEGNHYLLTDTNNGEQEFMGRAVTCEARPLIVATPYNIPFLLDTIGCGDVVYGELYRVDSRMLSVLDKLEGHPDYYTRICIEVELFDPDAVSADFDPASADLDLVSCRPASSNYSASSPSDKTSKSATNTCNNITLNSATIVVDKEEELGSTSDCVNNSSEKTTSSEFNQHLISGNSVGKTINTDILADENKCKNLHTGGVGNSSKLAIKASQMLRNGHKVKCETYVLRDFKKELLELPCLSNYSGEDLAKSNKCYVPVKDRPSNSSSSFFVKDKN